MARNLGWVTGCNRGTGRGICAALAGRGFDVIETLMTGDRTPCEAMLSSGRVPLRRWGSIEDVGRAAVGQAAGKTPYSTEDVVHVSGGFQIEQIT